MKHAIALLLVCLALWLGGCASQHDAASRVVAEAEQTLQSFKDDAQRLAPEQYAAAEQAIAKLKTQLEQRDFAGVITALPAMTTQLASLQELANTRRAELEAAIERARAEWSGLSLEVPASLDALQRRIDELAAAGKLPAGIDRNTLAQARQTLEDLRAKWAEALASFAQGRLPEAADQARESRDRAAELAAQLDVKTA
jgi:uncharacterized phage infection (PIP) family protein YhgE